MRTAVILITTLGLASSPAFADEKDTGVHLKIYENKQAIQENASDIDDLDSRVETNTDDIQALTIQVQNLPTGGGGANNDAQVQANTTAISNLSTQVQSNTTAISGLTTQTQNNASAIGANSVLIQTNTNGLASLTPQVTGNTSAINALTIDLNALQTTLTGLTADVGANTTEIGGLNTQVQTNTTAISSNTTRIEALEAGSGGGTPPPPSDPAIDFTLYLPTVTSKVFQIVNGAACNLMRHDISIVGTSLDVVETLTNGVQNCTVYNYGYNQSATELSLASYANVTRGITASFDTTNPVMTSTMSIGKTFGFAATDLMNPSQSVIQTNTLLGVESITVPFAAYNNCLKIHSQITSTVLPTTEQVSWHCQGVGEVKRVVMEVGINTMRVYNMTDAI